MLTQYSASLLDVLFLKGGLQKYSFHFQVVSFRNRAYAKPLETCKSFEVDLQFTSSNKRIMLASGFSRLLAKTAQCSIGGNGEHSQR